MPFKVLAFSACALLAADFIRLLSTDSSGLEYAWWNMILEGWWRDPLPDRLLPPGEGEGLNKCLDEMCSFLTSIKAAVRVCRHKLDSTRSELSRRPVTNLMLRNPCYI